MSKKLGELSTGLTRKILSIIALIGDPEVIILDEPFSSMDPLGRIKLSQIINREARTSDKVVIIASHVLSLLRPDKIYTITNFRVVGPILLSYKEKITAISPEGEIIEISTDDVEEYVERGFAVIDA